MILLLAVSLLLLSRLSNAQAPQQFSFQGVVRGPDGKIVANKSMLLGFSIKKGSPAGNAVFSETHTTSTDGNGIFNVQVGSVSTLPDIDWSSDAYFLGTIIYYDGLPAQVDLGTTQLLSVPYSLFSTKSNLSVNSIKSDTAVVSKKWIDDEPVVQTGSNNISSPLPDVPSGNMLIWYPKNAAFRVGVNNGDKWNRATMGVGSFATGNGTLASAENSASFGKDSEATGNGAFALGSGSKASGDYSFAAGNTANASGSVSTAIGQNVEASSTRSFAIGANSKATKVGAMAIGNGAESSGQDAIALGYNSKATSGNALAFGDGSEATGVNSVSFGNSIASGLRSFSAGEGVLAKAVGGIAIGTYNNSGDFPGLQAAANDRLFQLGHGTSASRANAITVLRNGNIGIGNNAVDPEYIMDFGGRPRIRHNGNTAGIFFNNSANAPEGFIGMKTDKQLGFYLNGAWQFWIDDTGKAFTWQGQLAFASDKRLKHNIRPLTGSLKTVSQLGGYNYNWIDPRRGADLQTGVIAQEVEKYLPELVHQDEKGFKAVNYIGLIPHLIEAVKELDKKTEEITALKKELASMQEMNRKLSALEASVKALLTAQGGTSTQTGK